ncbi:DUF3501 family protein [Candidatus Neomarinimicrobiota bacterium]
MKPVTLDDLVNIADYERDRDDIRKAVMEHKARRRVALGPDISLTFEDRQTIIFQIQEMMRAERMVHDDAIQEEIDIYNTLLPGENNLSATLFIEITEEARIKEKLHAFLGLTDGKSLWLQLGEERAFAEFEAGRSEEDKISSVHYVRFPLAIQVREILIDPAIAAKLCISHGDYRYETNLSKDARESLSMDFQEQNQ